MSQTNILLESGTNELEIVEFYINEEGYQGHYGINVAKVVEIIRMQSITAMPQMRHPSVIGAFPYRDGRVVPLIDLSLFLEKEAEEVEDPRIIVTEFNRVQTAFLVSGVNRIHRLSWMEIEPPGKYLQNISANSVTGVVKLEGRVVFLLDLEAIVAALNPNLAMHVESHAQSEHDENLQKFRIIHADDSASICKLVARMLEQDGRFELQQYSNGKDVLDHLMKLKEEGARANLPIESYVQGIVTDIEMPFMDGLTLCKEIKEDPSLRSLPVAIFSSLVTGGLDNKIKAVGADAQFSKPDLQGIADRIYELMMDKFGTNKG